MGYIDTLIANCQLAQKTEPKREFIIERLSELDNMQGLDGSIGAIYIIEQIDGNPEKTHEAFSFYKKSNIRKCPKVNKKPSHIMYVGSSTTGLKRRLSEHLGEGHKDTYALNLNHWFQGKYRITVKQYDVSRDILQIIEDALSYELKPAFGKQGGNGK